MTNKLKVLFLCTSNSCRSQIAEAYLRKYGGDFYEAHSAGLEPVGIHPLTVQVLQEAGISLDGHTSKYVSVYLGKVNFGYLITVCDNAEKNCPTTFLGISHRLHWALDDPAKFIGTPEETVAKFRQVRDQIDLLVQDFLVGEDLARLI